MGGTGGGGPDGSRAGGTSSPRSAPARKLSERHQLFALHYYASLNATEAYRRVYPTSKNPDVDGPKLLGTPGVKAFLDPLLAKRQQRLVLETERLDLELARVAYFDPGELQDPETGEARQLHELPEDTRRALAGVKVRELYDSEGENVGRVVEFKHADKVSAIGLAYKRLGLLKDKLEVTTKLSHEQLLLLAQKVREKKLAAGRAGAAVGRGAPAAPAGGRR